MCLLPLVRRAPHLPWVGQHGVRSRVPNGAVCVILMARSASLQGPSMHRSGERQVGDGKQPGSAAKRTNHFSGPCMTKKNKQPRLASAPRWAFHVMYSTDPYRVVHNSKRSHSLATWPTLTPVISSFPLDAVLRSDLNRADRHCCSLQRFAGLAGVGGTPLAHHWHTNSAGERLLQLLVTDFFSGPESIRSHQSANPQPPPPTATTWNPTF